MTNPTCSFSENLVSNFIYICVYVWMSMGRCQEDRKVLMKGENRPQGRRMGRVAEHT